MSNVSPLDAARNLSCPKCSIPTELSNQKTIGVLQCVSCGSLCAHQRSIGCTVWFSLGGNERRRPQRSSQPRKPVFRVDRWSEGQQIIDSQGRAI